MADDRNEAGQREAGGAGGGQSGAAQALRVAARVPESVVRDARRIVVKVGSTLVTNEGRGLDEDAISR